MARWAWELLCFLSWQPVLLLSLSRLHPIMPSTYLGSWGRTQWEDFLFGQLYCLALSWCLLGHMQWLRDTWGESVHDMIVEGLYLGGWPFLLKHLPPGNPSVIDCTCELPRSSFVPKDEYLCLATWDTRAPTPSQIELAARWACEKRSKGKPVYVHCAFG